MNKNKVRVYRNLNKKCLSVQSWVEGKGWRVTDHVQKIFLDDASFQVSQAGRNRVLKQQKKNVHAFIIGKRVDAPKKNPVELVKYNPYHSPNFYYVANPNRFPISVSSVEITPKMIKASLISA